MTEPVIVRRSAARTADRGSGQECYLLLLLLI